mmetsp:Transcript_6460/g.9599  ORF Transcript_6460/g.9599 Transcript_6460/m.9599 type:complete len:139 (+) Transcript_6460:3-419(+)
MNEASLNSKLWSQETSHSVESVTPNEKHIELRVILLERLSTIELKSGDVIYQFLVADQTGCIKCNFFGEVGRQLKPSDILYMTGLYATLYKETTLTLYTGKRSKVYKIGEFFMLFSEEKNMSETQWERDSKGFFVLKQ